MNPASVMKLVTTFAGLELLGPAYTWKTESYARWNRKDDTLHGNLVIKGYGDPKLNLENFWLLTRRLRQTGLREITGDLVLDSSHFDLPNGDPAAFDGKPYRAYNVLPEALLVNYRTLALRLIPQPGSKTVRIVVDPLPASLDLKNSLTLTNGPCSEWRDALAYRYSYRHQGQWSRIGLAQRELFQLIAAKKPCFSASTITPTISSASFGNYGRNRAEYFVAR